MMNATPPASPLRGPGLSGAAATVAPGKEPAQVAAAAWDQ